MKAPTLKLYNDLVGMLRAYASILFAEKPWVGALFVLATLWFPNTGLAGLWAAIVGMTTAALLKFRNLESGLHVYNSLLVGLSLGAYYYVDVHLLLLISFASVLAVFVTVAVSDITWRLNRLPALSLPFVVVALMATLAAQSYGTLSRYLVPMAPHDMFVSAAVDQFFTSLGSAFFTPHPFAGLLMFIGLAWTSRYLAFLAMTGFLFGFSTYTYLSGSPHPDLVAWNGFNFILVAMAIGGLFTVPSKASFILAMLGSVIAALVTASSETFMLVYGLPVMALPFLITTLTMLLALTHRPATSNLQLTLDAPALPEISYERARLAKARQGEFGSVPVRAPFFGAWQIYQGFDGKHTHQEPWQHALDFYITEHEQSYRSHGRTLDDYYCFGLPVVAPVEGYVVKTLDTLSDNPPGEVDTENNWGNHVLIRMHNGLYLLLAHLKQGSIETHIGAYVTVGTRLAACGSSGRSPQPHLHMHVQWGDVLGGHTHAFHLTSVLQQDKQDATPDFRLFSQPSEGQSVIAAKYDPALRECLNLSVGRKLTYQVEYQGEQCQRTLHVELSLLGELHLVSDRGAKATFTTQDNILAFYNRQGKTDLFFDAWLLTMGLTPLQEGNIHWHDEPPLALLPLSMRQYLYAVLSPALTKGMQSEYQRQWQGGVWVQRGRHQFKNMFLQTSFETKAEIQPKLGCMSFVFKGENLKLQASLLEIAQQGDAGIPAWQITAEDKKML
ncbi:urea transporter [Ghiorsea bivora]|uniref:urea transporter n=1 Tax=Ghiorsea bivora TaxID=1485545 RepID=UPI00068E9330|nr:urea transporter [Ghiorsea bivora]